MSGCPRCGSLFFEVENCNFYPADENHDSMSEIKFKCYDCDLEWLEMFWMKSFHRDVINWRED